MAKELIHLDPEQKRLLARHAKLRRLSLSEEVSRAIDLYLAMPMEIEDELKLIARTANRSADRIIKNLDDTIAYVDHILKTRGPRQTLPARPQS
jgi:hypothetical protein